MLCIDLFCGLFGWGTAFAQEGYRVIGFDIEQHGPVPEGCELVLQNMLTLHGSQFRDATVIVASPPCQKYSYMAMPWTRAKREAAWQRWQRDSRFWTDRSLNDLFNACFRIQREASEAAGRHIPLVVENVKGAQPWVGRAKVNYGSFYLWGDVESVGGRIVKSGPIQFGMPAVKAASRGMKHNPDGTQHPISSWFAVSDSKNSGVKAGDRNPDGKGWSHSFADSLAAKNSGGSWFAQAHNTESGHGQNPDGRKVPGMNWSKHGDPDYKPQGFNVTAAQRYRDEQRYGTKVSDDWFGSYAEQKAAGTISPGRLHGKNSDSRKAASAQIAKIPFPLAQHIARCFSNSAP